VIKRNKRNEDTIDIGAFLRKFYIKWYYFVISILICLCIAYIKVRYTKPVYAVGASLLIHQNESSSGLSELNLFFGGKGNIDNELGKLKAYSLTDEVIKALAFNVSYFIEGNIQEVELYKSSPIVVELDTTKNQAIHVPIFVKIISRDKVRIQLEEEINTNLYNYSTGEFKSSTFIKPFTHELNFGETFSNDFFSFKVFLRDTTQKIGERNKRLFFKLRSYEELVSEYLNKVTVTKASKMGTILSVSSTGTVIDKEIDFLNRYLEVYLKEGLDIKNEMAVRTIDFIDKQLSGISDSLFINENSLEEFRKLNKTFDVTESSKRLITNLEQLGNELSLIKVQMQYYDYLKNYLLTKYPLKKEEIIAPSSIGINDPLLTKLIGDLASLLEERNKLSLSTTEGNPYVKALNSKIETVTQSLIENVQNIMNSAQIQQRSIEKRIQDIEQEMNTLPAKERRLINIQRKYQINDNIYTFLLQKKAEAAISKASNTADNRIIDRARLVSKVPLTPKTNIIYVTAFILGFLIPFLIILSAEFLNDKIQTREELESLITLPILGVINHYKQKNKIAVVDNPKSITTELFRTIRINLEYFATDKSQKIIAITSSLSGEGKTFCSVNLASIISITGKKTILIGADLRKPRIADFFDVTSSDSLGLTNYLSGSIKDISQIIHGTSIENLEVIPSGPIPPNPAELLGNGKLASLLTLLKEKYDYIIIDTPPLMLVADYLVIQKHVDLSIYVIRQDYTYKKLIDKLQDLYEDNRLANTTVVLNDVKIKGAGYGYGYGYSYGAGYYDEEQPNYPFYVKWFKAIFNKYHN
jgi:capsular exopolysaccharide synthesis family protein